MEGGTLTIATPGGSAPFSRPRRRRLQLFVNGLDDSWWLRHAPSPLVQLAGRFHAFNDVRIATAGWIEERSP
jgi:hypothetical protein